MSHQALAGVDFVFRCGECQGGVALSIEEGGHVDHVFGVLEMLSEHRHYLAIRVGPNQVENGSLFVVPTVVKIEACPQIPPLGVLNLNFFVRAVTPQTAPFAVASAIFDLLFGAVGLGLRPCVQTVFLFHEQLCHQVFRR